MNALFKTLFGSLRTLAVAGLSLLLALLALHSPIPALAGLVLPVALLASAYHLALH